MLKEEVLREALITPEIPKIKIEKIEVEKREEIEKEEVIQPEKIGKTFTIFKDKDVNFVRDVVETYRHFRDVIKLKTIKMEIEFEGTEEEKENFVNFLRKKRFRIV